MNNQNNQSQGFPNQQPQNQNQQVPDHRIADMEKRFRELELQNTQLRTTVDFLKGNAQQRPAQQDPNVPAFKPEVAGAIDKLLESKLAPMHEQYRQQIGYMQDRLDQANYKLSYGGDKYAPYHEKVEQLHQQNIAQGRWVPREEILRMVHFEEAGKKQTPPDPQQVQQQAQPKFDPFFNKYVDPNTGLPIQGAQENPEDPGQNQQMPNPQMQNQFQPQVPAWQQQPPQNQYQQPPQQGQYGSQQPGVRQPMNTQHPHGNAYGQQFQLPNQGVNNPAGNQGQPNPRAPLSLESGDAELEAFERNFGEIPL